MPKTATNCCQKRSFWQVLRQCCRFGQQLLPGVDRPLVFIVIVVPRTRTIRSVGVTLPCRAQRHGTAVQQPPCRTADFNSVHRDICTKTQKSSLWLLAPLKTLSIWRYINVRIHSFIHSFIPLLDYHGIPIIIVEFIDDTQ